ncbi:transcriptional regulator with XRE-family HTH domain [Neisseria perflava]|uniref:helix-turn-helix domain-containing protein n=1 Tax=Neisseria perflava TaxID=33053 RepID=UPI0020A1E20E|nr:helix-turn-helix domain-containing protein [Neisseria perflava]MCP1773476.1 transcriptional regulator with XRE-family HTH domain [Neisseria perflava]
MNKNSDFASRLKDLRIKWNQSQGEIAKTCGVSVRMWAKYEQGLSIPGGEVLTALALQGAPIEYLLTGWELDEKDELQLVLSDKEVDLIENYRSATDKNKEIIFTVAEMVEKKPKSRKLKADNIALFLSDMED